MHLIKLVVLSLFVFATPALAHSWYSEACCEEEDCRPARAGEVQFTPEGWYVVPTKELIPFGDYKEKISEDGEFHICQYYKSGSFNQELTTRCLYVPEVGA